MSNIIVLTGSDGSGKSTMSEELLKNINAQYTHFSKPESPEDAKNQYFNFLNKLEDDKIYLCDRYHEGEWIYGPLMRNTHVHYLNELENAIVQKNNYLYVYVTANVDEILRRVEIRGEDYVQNNQFLPLRQLFDKFMFQTQHLPFIHVDTTNTPLEDNLKLIMESYDKLNKIWDSLRNCNKCNNVVSPLALPRGNVNAKYMIVGQNPGGKGKFDNKYTPIFSQRSTSQFLINTLIEANIYKDCWLTNLVLCGTSDNKINNNLVEQCINNLKLQLNLIKPQKIFALGNQTYKYLINNFKDYEIINVEHPTYVKRFFSKSEERINNYVGKFKI